MTARLRSYYKSWEEDLSTEDSKKNYADGALEIHYNDKDDEHSVEKISDGTPTEMVNELVAKINKLAKDEDNTILFISEADEEEDDDDDDDDD